MNQKELKQYLIDHAGDFQVFRPEEDYAKVLNENHELAKICGYEYEKGDVLKAVDPICYRQEYLYYLESEIMDGILFQPDQTQDIFYYVEEINEKLKKEGIDFRVEGKRY